MSQPEQPNIPEQRSSGGYIPGSVGEVVHTVDAAIEKINSALGWVGTAQEMTEQAHANLTHVLDGTANPLAIGGRDAIGASNGELVNCIAAIRAAVENARSYVQTIT